MKKLQLLFFGFLLIQFSSLAQNWWFPQTSGTSNNLQSIYFTDQNNGCIVGDSGTILCTSDGGENWLLQTSGTSNHLYSVYFFEYSGMGWAVGDSGVILNTTDFGVHWNFQNSGTNFRLNDVIFVDENKGWAVGGLYNTTYTDGIIIRTTDGGNTWLTQMVSASFFYSVCFYDENTGWVTETSIENNVPSRTSRILKTTNGGNEWTVQDTLIYSQFLELCFVDETNGWVSMHKYEEPGASTEVYKTTNGGENWASVFTSYGPNPSISFVDKNNGWLVTGTQYLNPRSKIYHTTNGGIDWTLQMSGSTLNSIFFVDSITGWVVGDEGAIIHTTNGGVSFIEENEIDAIPTEYSLSYNYPNPFNPSTKIKYSIPQSSNIVIKVFDILGNEIETLVNDEKQAGTYEITWYAENLPSGVYFYQLRAGDFLETKKMILLK